MLSHDRIRPELFDPTAATIVRHLRALGYGVSVFHQPSSLYKTVPACVELHAVTPDGQQHIGRELDDGIGDGELRAAFPLAASIGAAPRRCAGRVGFK